MEGERKYTRGGGESCAVVGCSNNRKRIYVWKKRMCDVHGILHEDCPCMVPYRLHSFPKDRDERLRWQGALQRKYLPKVVYVCSDHFIDGKPTFQNPTPSLRLGYDTPIKTGRRVLQRNSVLPSSTCTTETQNCSSQPTGPEDVDENSFVYEDSHVIGDCKKATANPNLPNSVFDFPGSKMDISDNAAVETVTSGTQWEDLTLMDHSYTCSSESRLVPNVVKTFEEKGVNCRTNHITMSATQLISDNVCYLYTGLSSHAFNTLVQVMENIGNSFKFTMTLADQILLTLMKLRLNLLFADLAFRFGISESHASNIFNTWLPWLSSNLKDLIVWLPRDTLRASLPASFQENFPKTTVIIDCAETFMQRPKNLKTRGETYSHYKSHNTVKYLVGIAPHGQIMFISHAFGGRASDKFIVERSGFLNYLLPGDEVMADRGFTIDDLLFPRRVKLNIPAFTKGKQLSEQDVTQTRRIAHVRIHVERAIRRLKVFRILSDMIPVTCAKKVDDILIVCAALVNLGNALMKESENPDD